jgi:hypothetical protein
MLFTEPLPSGVYHIIARSAAVTQQRVYILKFQFYLQSVLVHSENCVKDVYSGM